MVTSVKDGMWCNCGDLTMLNNANPMLSEAHLTNYNFNNFKVHEAMGLRIIALRSTWMSSILYQISWQSAKQFRIYP
jgi:hypothetical protein